MSVETEMLHDELEEIEAQEKRKRRVLAQILDSIQGEKGKFLALRGEMGESLLDSGKAIRVPSYSVVHDMNWIGQTVKMGSEMAFMETSIDADGRLIINQANAEKIRQRAPDWSRQPGLTAYLAHDKHRKFGSILAVISPQWVDDPQHEKWGSDKKALRSAIEFSALDSEGRIGLIDLDEYDVYALDGQHRVMGIRGVRELQEGGLNLKKKDGTPAKGRISRDEFLAKFGLGITEFQRLLSERMTVEYIPAVVQGETREEATRRVRHVFASINQYAKRPDKGEQILLDESDGYSIVARSVGLAHPLFERDKLGDRVNWKNTSIARRSNWYTTLQHLREAAQEYLGQKDVDRGKRWKPFFSNQVPIRPDEADLDKAERQLTEFFDYVSELPVFRGLASGDDLEEVREFTFKDKAGTTKQGKGHLLLRPIGQSILARAVGRLVAKGHQLNSIFAKLNKFDLNGGFETNNAKSIWYKVTYDPIKEKMIISNQNTLAPALLVYLVEGAKSEEREDLLNQLIEARKIDDAQWVNFEGKTVPVDWSRIQMPPAIS